MKRNQQKIQLQLPSCLALIYAQITCYKVNFIQFVIYVAQDPAI